MYSLRLLGGIFLEGPSGPLSGRVVQHRQLAVLALLAMARDKGCSRDKLVGCVWPESPEERARHLLADSIYLLRKSLGDDAVSASSDVLRLNADIVWTDAVAFRETLERGDLKGAVKLYGGPFLDGFFGDDSPEFEHWVEAERRDLADRQANALESLAAGAEGTSDYTRAVVWWRRLAAHDPYNSRVVLRLMQALAAAGDPANAIHQAQEHAACLQKELELDPPSELASFVERLRIEAAGGEPARGAAPPATDDEPTRTPERRTLEPSPRRSLGRLLKRHRIATAGLAALAIPLIALLVRQLVISGPTQSERRSIAVLPFENLTGDPGKDYLAAGFHEELINQLARIGGVRVIARSSVKAYGDSRRSLRTVAKELDVDHILEASLRAEGERLRITVQLIDPETSGHIWAEDYDRVRDALLDVQRDIALRIAESVRAHITPEELASIDARPTENQDAYDYYLRGVNFDDQLDRRTAIRMYERAIELDSSFALAYAKMASARSILYRWFMDRTDDHLTKAGLAVERALELQPNLLEAHLALYNFRSAQLDRPGAMEALARARALAPNDPRVHRWLALAVRQTGQFEESAQHLDRALEYSPRWRSLLYNAATTALYRREYSAAQQYLNRGFEISPEDGSLGEAAAILHVNWDGDLEKAWHGYQIYCQRRNPRLPNPTMSHWRAVARILNHHYQEALRQHTLATFGPDTLRYFYLKALSYQATAEMELARAYADSGRVVMEDHLARTADDDPFQDQRHRHGYLAYFYALLGRHDEAIREAETGVRLLPDSVSAVRAPIRVGTLTEVYVMVGEHEAAIDQLEHLLSVPSYFSARQLELDPIWKPLRDHPRFQALLKRN